MTNEHIHPKALELAKISEEQAKAVRLNLGCGNDYREGWINIDARQDVKTDFKHNLNVYPYPLPNDLYSEIEMRMILEHLDNPIRCLKECIRMAKNGCIIRITVPHARSLAQVGNITHRTFFTEHSFDAELLKEYELENLKLISSDWIYANTWKGFIPFKKFWNVFLNGIYEDMEFVFEVKK